MINNKNNHEHCITVDNITKTFSNPDITENKKIYALKNISFTVKEGECLIIGGANGSGKSLLMSIIAGLIKPTSGKIYTKEKVGLIFQEAETQILGETAIEDVMVGISKKKFSKEQRKEKALQVLQEVALFEKSLFPARTLSGGEKRKLAVASILAMETSTFIFDEPYANLDYKGIQQVNNLIKELKKKKCTIIILTHELEKCLALASRFIVLYKGEKVFDGLPSQGLNQDLEVWNIRNPIQSYTKIEDLLWD